MELLGKTAAPEATGGLAEPEVLEDSEAMAAAAAQSDSMLLEAMRERAAMVASAETDLTGRPVLPARIRQHLERPAFPAGMVETVAQADRAAWLVPAVEAQPAARTATVAMPGWAEAAATVEREARVTMAQPARVKTPPLAEQVARLETAESAEWAVRPADLALRLVPMAIAATEALAGLVALEARVVVESRGPMVWMRQTPARLKMATTEGLEAMVRRAALAEPAAWVERHRELVWQGPTAMVAMEVLGGLQGRLETAALAAREVICFRTEAMAAMAAILVWQEMEESAERRAALEPPQARMAPMGPSQPAVEMEGMAEQVSARQRPAQLEAMAETEAMADLLATVASEEPVAMAR